MEKNKTKVKCDFGWCEFEATAVATIIVQGQWSVYESPVCKKCFLKFLAESPEQLYVDVETDD